MSSKENKTPAMMDILADFKVHYLGTLKGLRLAGVMDYSSKKANENSAQTMSF